MVRTAAWIARRFRSRCWLTTEMAVCARAMRTKLIEMIRGERGDHGCQAKARPIVVNDQPVQPHELFDVANDNLCHANWVPVPAEVVTHVCLQGKC